MNTAPLTVAVENEFNAIAARMCLCERAHRTGNTLFVRHSFRNVFVLQNIDAWNVWGIYCYLVWIVYAVKVDAASLLPLYTTVVMIFL